MLTEVTHRQYHPESIYLPRKLKIAVTGSPLDRAASEVHDIGLHLVESTRPSFLT